jgi:ATP-dependent DNA helicase RecG
MPALTDDELEALLLTGESDRTERKRNASDLDRIREAVCAFANDLPDRREPGVVFVGIEDNGNCAHLAINDALLKDLGQIRDDGNLTPFPTMEVRRAHVTDCLIAVVIVQPSENPPVRCRGRAWIRVGPRRAIATADEERRLTEKRRWGNLPFDAQPVTGSSLDDLDVNRFQLEYLPALVSADTVAQNQRSIEQQLRALRLIDGNNVPTTTAILMLGRSPQEWFPGSVIAWRRVGGTNLTDTTLDERVLAGTIPDQLRRIDEFMDAANSAAVEMGAKTHLRTADYPLAALQQLVRNAVMHRAYESTSSPCRVTWYSDRIEILSPGGPFGAVTPDTFGMPGFTDYRNPTLSEALKGYGFVERFGQGIEIARASMATNGNPPLEFQFQPIEAPTWVHVTIRKSP